MNDNNEITDNKALKLAVGMHESFNALGTKFNLEFELNTYMWLRYGDREIGYNTDGNKEDLFEYDGNSYSLALRWIQYEDDDFVLAKVDNGGDQYMSLFLKKNEVFWDE